ncbi:MAG TPA: YggT family protein [Gemmatimonadales bacterium]
MLVLDLIRYGVFGVLVVGGAAAVGSWAVTTRRINPFSRTARFIRSTTDPMLDPVERWLLTRGGNPQSAPWWMLGIIIGGGIAVITVSQWLATTVLRAGAAAKAGPRGVLGLGVYYGGQLIILALIVRVIGSWFGAGRYNPWMRLPHLLTDWIMTPLRRMIPPFGMLDLTPIFAYVALRIMIAILLRII